MKQNNLQLATIFRSMADLLSSQRANPYRVRAYRRAADALLAIEEDVSTVADRQGLEEIDGIGNDLAKKIEEFLTTGTIRAYEELKTPLPPEVQNWVTLAGALRFTRDLSSTSDSGYEHFPMTRATHPIAP
ncbi:MAG: hypothetical protein HC794_01525 [Nitrospiraceae bacterium]|nr:hypothetical protein [Nitrospiraceae bacterium]